MARLQFSMSGADDLLREADQISQRMLTAVTEGAELLKTFTQQEGRTMGVYRTGETLNAMVLKKPRRTGDGASCTITYQGLHSGNPRRNGEVAFVNEYGARGRAGRPFNQSAMDEHEEAVLQRMEDILSI